MWLEVTGWLDAATSLTMVSTAASTVRGGTQASPAAQGRTGVEGELLAQEEGEDDRPAPAFEQARHVASGSRPEDLLAFRELLGLLGFLILIGQARCLRACLWVTEALLCASLWAPMFGHGSFAYRTSKRGCSANERRGTLRPGLSTWP